MNSDKQPDKRALSKSRDNWGIGDSRKQPCAINKPARQQSQSSKSIMNSLDHKGKSTGSDCGSVRKIRRPAKDPGFKTIKNRVLGVDKENKKEVGTGLYKGDTISSLKKMRPLNSLETSRTNTSSQQYLKPDINKERSNSQNRFQVKSHAHNIKIAPETAPKPVSLDNFEIGKKLGKGRFGDVNMIRDKRTGFIMAMKSINKQQLRQSDMFTQLYFEIKLQSFVNHPNALKMYGYFQDQKNIYLLLELAANSCMFRELKSKSCLKQDQAAYYLRQVIAGIKYLHSHSIMHRDIKPENILNSFGVLKLCDFGWAVYSPLYQRQTFCGTLDYVPPEIVTGQFYDEKVDLWCIGVLCYEMCTGHAPFEAKKDELETYDRILSLDLQFPVSLSQQVVDFISRLLTKDPQERMGFTQMEEHPFMKKYENQSGRLISKEIWESWHNFRS